MGLRFNRRITLFPGVRINVGLGGVSASVGPRGASVTLGKRGVRANLGVPGTGLSYSKNLSSKSRARAQKQEQRWQREQERAAKWTEVRFKLNQEDGTVSILDANNLEITGRQRSLIFEAQAQAVEKWLLDAVDKLNGDVDLLEEIYLDSPDISDHPEFTPVPFATPKPQKPDKPIYAAKPELTLPATLGFFARFFKAKRDEHQAKVLLAEKTYKNQLEQWQKYCDSLDAKYIKRLADYPEQLHAWKAAKALYEAEQVKAEQSFRARLESDTELMEEMLSDTLNDMEWPRETHIDFQLAENGSDVWLDVDLPEIEDLPQKVATVAANGRKLNIKDKTKKQLQLEYAQHIYGIGLRLACHTLASLPAAKRVIISGYSQRLHLATGKVNEDYLFSTKFTREGLNQLNFAALEKVDPMFTHDMFENRKKMTVTGIFHPIEPFEIA